MRTKIIAGGIFAFVAISNCHAEQKKVWTKQEITQIIPGDQSGNGEIADKAAFYTLLEAGEDIYPQLSELLLETRDHLFKGAIVNLMAESNGNKEIPIRAFEKYIETNIGKDPEDKDVYGVIAALGDIGGAKEAEFLHQYLSVTAEPLRSSIEGSLKKIERRLKTQEMDAMAHERTERRLNGANSGAVFEANKNANEEAENVFQLKSHWLWVAGGSLLLLMAVIRLKRRFGTNTES